jgi:hypothetical protein
MPYTKARNGLPSRRKVGKAVRTAKHASCAMSSAVASDDVAPLGIRVRQ